MTIEEFSRKVEEAKKAAGLVIDENGKFKSDDTTWRVDGVDYDMSWFFVNNIPFYGISFSGFMTVNTKTFVEEPERQNDGSMPNIDDHETFLVPRATFNLKFFDIESYRRLLKATEANSFDVTYYDKDYGEWVTHNMYLTPQEMTKIYNIGSSLIGVLDFEVAFVGTLNNVQTFTLTYNSNYEGSSSNPFNITNYRGDYTNGTTYTKDDIVKWNTDGNYYKAIYYNDTFSDKPISNTAYWSSVITVSEWNNATTYSQGAVVYTIRTNSENENVYAYYEYIYESSSSGASLSNPKYWKKFTPLGVYSSSTTYEKGNYVYNSNGNYTQLNKAIFEEYSFVADNINNTPDNSNYWVQVAVVTGETVKWGYSANVLNPESLFNAPTNKHSDKWNTKADGTGYTYYPNKNITITSDVTLYAIWE